MIPNITPPVIGFGFNWNINTLKIVIGFKTLYYLQGPFKKLIKVDVDE